jgi:TRAP-type mannitol/chloroaromatic compound transport system substrate-binding protein
MSNITRRGFAHAGSVGIIGALATPAAPAAPAVAHSGKLRWRMVTSWPKRLPGPGMSAGHRRRAHRQAVRRPA